MVVDPAGLLTACSTTPAPPVATTCPFVDGTGATVQVPDRPSRIYAVRDNEIAGLLRSLGGSVVGFNGDVDPIRRAGLDPGSAVAQAGELDIEAVAALRPDLIVLAARRRPADLRRAQRRRPRRQRAVRRAAPGPGRQVLRFDENVYGKHLVNYATVARTPPLRFS